MKRLLILGLLVAGLSGCGVDSVSNEDLGCLESGGTAEECGVNIQTNKNDIEEIKDQLTSGSVDNTIPLQFNNISSKIEAEYAGVVLTDKSISTDGNTVTFSEVFKSSKDPRYSYTSIYWSVLVEIKITQGNVKVNVKMKQWSSSDVGTHSTYTYWNSETHGDVTFKTWLQNDLGLEEVVASDGWESWSSDSNKRILIEDTTPVWLN